MYNHCTVCAAWAADDWSNFEGNIFQANYQKTQDLQLMLKKQWRFWDSSWMNVLRQMFFQKMLFRPCRTLSSIRSFRASPAIPIFSSVKSSFILIKSPSPSPFPRLCQSSLSQEACNVSLVSVLQHPEYEGMKKKLEVKAQSALDLACLHILVR